MKTIGLEQTTLQACVEDAQNEQVIVTRDGRPVALVVGLANLDDEQLELGKSDKFWALVSLACRILRPGPSASSICSSRGRRRKWICSITNPSCRNFRLRSCRVRS